MYMLMQQICLKSRALPSITSRAPSRLTSLLLMLRVQAITAGANPIAVKRGILKTCDHLVIKLKENAKPVTGRNDIKNIAAISSGNDEIIGEMIASALDKVGSNGVLSIESSNTTETFVEVQEGMAIDRGYISPQFVNVQVRPPAPPAASAARM